MDISDLIEHLIAQFLEEAWIHELRAIYIAITNSTFKHFIFIHYVQTEVCTEGKNMLELKFHFQNNTVVRIRVKVL